MQYQVRSSGKAEYLFFEEEAIRGIRASGSGVELRLDYNRHYLNHPDYRFDTLRQQHLLTLTKGQSVAIIEFDREKRKTFCTGGGGGCYDHGKTNTVPPSCVRCQLLAAVLRANGGDYRQKPSEAILAPVWGSNGQACGMILLVLAFWWALCQWTWASVRLERIEGENVQLRRQIERVKR